MAEEQENELHPSRTMRGAHWIKPGAGAAGVELPGGLGRLAVYSGEGQYRVPTRPGDDADKEMLRRFSKDLKRYRGSATTSFG